MNRLDKYIVELLRCSRTKAIDLIKSKAVSINGLVVDKPSYIVKETDKVEIAKQDKKEVKLIDVN